MAGPFCRATDSVFKKPTLRRPETLFFGRPGPVSLFSFSPPMRGWSAGRRQGACEAPFKPALRSAGFTRRASGTQVLGGWGSRGARALAKGPAPPGAPTRAIVGRRTWLRPSNAAIDGALSEPGDPAYIPIGLKSRPCRCADILWVHSWGLPKSHRRVHKRHRAPVRRPAPAPVGELRSARRCARVRS